MNGAPALAPLPSVRARRWRADAPTPSAAPPVGDDLPHPDRRLRAAAGGEPRERALARSRRPALCPRSRRRRHPRQRRAAAPSSSPGPTPSRSRQRRRARRSASPALRRRAHERQPEGRQPRLERRPLHDDRSARRCPRRGRPSSERVPRRQTPAATIQSASRPRLGRQLVCTDAQRRRSSGVSCYIGGVSDADRRARALARTQRAILHKTTVSAQERDLSPIAGAEAVSLLTRLSRESFQLAGLGEPTYARAQIPCRFVRGRLT